MDIKKLNEQIEQILNSSNQDLINENANTDGQSPMGMMGLFASALSKEYALNLLADDVRTAFEDGFIHIHDFDYYLTGTTTCCQLPLGKMLETGFKVGDCYMRPPRSITSAMALSSILIQSNQNQQHGGQSYPNWDFDLAPYAELSYEKHKKALLAMDLDLSSDQIEKLADEKTKQETFQAAEAFVHNANSMLSRNGMQVPFVSINFGLDTSKFGRMVSEQTLLAQMAGLGDGSTPLFPILVFKLKKGINTEPNDPNYDIYRVALKCLSERLFPNFQFVDTPFNSQGFDIDDPSTHIATMGCRTRVYNDVTTGKSSGVGRGNLSFTTLNLPMIAQQAGTEEAFWAELDFYTQLAIKQLLDRYEYQRLRRASSFKLLYDQGVWAGADLVGEDGLVGDAIKTGTLSVGFVGLAEALIILRGAHHGEDPQSQELGLKIIKHLSEAMNEAKDKYQLNFSLLATPAESYAGKALVKFKAKFGEVDRVTSYDFFTNSNHLPVYYQTTVKHKIETEAPYHAYTDAGHILYVELDGAASKNIQSLDDIVKYMMKNEVGYGSINHPIDRCRACNTHAIIEHECPKCGSTDISRIRRITGYLVGDMSKWNSAKYAEESKRVKHGKN